MLNLENQLLTVMNLNKSIPLRLLLIKVSGSRFKTQDSIQIQKILILMKMTNFKTNKIIIFSKKSFILHLFTEIRIKN